MQTHALGLLDGVVDRASGEVYHYTTAEGFRQIVQTGTLRATEAFGMNDLAELRFGWAVIHDWLSDKLSKNTDDEVIKQLLDLVPDQDDNMADGVYLLCGTTLPDDASQWRLYGGRARGYNLALDADEGLAIFHPGSEKEEAQLSFYERLRGPGVGVAPWIKVLYTEEEQYAALERFTEVARREIEQWSDRISNLTKAELEESDPQTGETYGEYLADEGGVLNEELRAALARMAHVMKSGTFESEREVRIVVRDQWSRAIEFRSTANGVARAVRLVARRSTDRDKGRNWVTEAAPLPLLSVRMGPAQVTSNSRRPTEALLEAFGYREKLVGLRRLGVNIDRHVEVLESRSSVTAFE